jgi:hypothetical protein
MICPFRDSRQWQAQAPRPGAATEPRPSNEGRERRAGPTAASAPAGTKTKKIGAPKLAWIEGVVNALLEPVGRSQRAKAVSRLPKRPASVPTFPQARATRRRPGWLVATITEVLASADVPMRAIDIHGAAESALGEPVLWSSVKNCLCEGIAGRPSRFERVARGRYRLRRR